MSHEISRRQLLTGAAALAVSRPSFAVTPNTLTLPKALNPGDKVAIFVPAGASDGEEHLKRASEKISSLGFSPVVMPNALKRWGYLGGTDAERAADINLALNDSSIRALFALRGGYGAMRLLDKLDYEALSKDPKPILGYSDITALLLAFYRRSGVVTFHGPCAESRWNDYQRSSLRLITERKPGGIIPPPPEDAQNIRTLVPGKAKGALVGGNLSLVVALLETPYGVELKDKILFLEDIGEEPYRVDRMLTQLLLTRQLSSCAGIVFGNFRDRSRAGQEAAPTDPSQTFSLDQVLMDRCKAAGVPAFSGLNFGHIAQNHILPLGVQAEMDSEKGQLTLHESAVQ